MAKKFNKGSKNYKGKGSMKRRVESGSQDEYMKVGEQGSKKPFPDKADRRDCRLDDIRSNDIAWYNKSGIIFDDATRLPFNRIMGDPLRGRFNADGSTRVAPDLAVPGVMTIEYIPTIGISKSSNDPINRAFNTIYGDIYSKTTGAMQFQQMDLAFFTMSMMSVVAWIGYAKKALEVSYLWSGQNYYYPRLLLSAMGIWPDEVIGYQDDWRIELNTLIDNFNALRVPNFMDCFKRAYSLAHNMYVDEDTIRGQLYNFRPAGYYKYVDTGDPAYLEWVPNFTKPGVLPVAAQGEMRRILTNINAMLNAWRNSSDLGLISGSIQRAYPNQSLLSLDRVMVDQTMVPIYDRNINWQINNLRTVNIVNTSTTTSKPGTATLNILQDPIQNCLIFNPPVQQLSQNKTEFSDMYAPNFLLLNSYDGTKDSEFVMEATRLMPFVQNLGTDGDLAITTMGLEIPINMAIYTRTADTSGVNTNISVVNLTSQMVIDMNEAGKMDVFLTTLSRLTQFRNHPRVDVFVTSTDTSATIFYVGTIGDLAEYTTIDYTAMYGLSLIHI